MEGIYTRLNLFVKRNSPVILKWNTDPPNPHLKHSSTISHPHLHTNTHPVLQTKNLPKMEMSTMTNTKKFSLVSRWITSLILLMTVFINQSTAQIGYSRTTLTGQTYTQLTGAGITVINTTAGLTPGVMSTTQDDGAAIVTLPFTWTYNGNTFTQVTFCTNGWVGGGAQTAVTPANSRIGANLFNTTEPFNVIAPWFKDMGANFPGDGSMRHGLIGTDIYAFQWDQAVGNSFSVTTTDKISFQVNIYGPASTNPGRIDLIYGPQVGTLATAASIGIKNAIGGPGNFLNAIDNNTTSTTTSSAWVGNGNGYRFDPLPACTAPVAQPTALTQGATTISSISGSFTAAAVSSGYLVVRYPSGATVTAPVDGTSYTAGASLGAGTIVSTGTSTTFSVTGLTNGTTYDFYVYNYSNTACTGLAYNTVSPLAASFATNTPGTILSNPVSGGNWNDVNTWAGGVVPTVNDNVVITDGADVIINVAAVANNITIGQGTGGLLRYDEGTARSLTVTQSVTVAAAGTFRSGASGSITGHQLTVGTNLVNNGAINFSTNLNTAGAEIIFVNATNNSFSGSGTSNLRTLTINKGSGAATRFSPVLEITLTNAPTFLATAGINTTTWNGILKISGTNTWASQLFSSVTYIIPSTGGLWLNNPNFSVTGIAGSPTLTGLLRITNGTYNIGTASGNSLGLSTNSTVIIEGGAISSTGAFGVASAANTITYIQSAGTVTVNTIGYSSTTLAAFDLGTSTTSKDTLTGGTVIIQLTNGGASGPRDYRGTSLSNTTSVITGGLVQLGNAASGLAKTFYTTGLAPAITVNTASAQHNVNVTGNTTVNGAFINPSTGTLTVAGVILNFKGSISNSAAITANTALSNITFQGTSAQTLGGTITGGDVANVTVNNPAGAVITSAVRINTALTLTAGTLATGGTTLGNAGTNSFTFISSGGTLSGAATINYGTGTNNFTYNSSTASQTTGAELPAFVGAGTLLVNNTFTGGSVTLNSPLSIPNLTLTAGKLNTSATNLIVVRGVGTGAVTGGSTTSYVAGPLQRTLAGAVATGNTYRFPVGRSAYQLYEMINPTTGGAATDSVKITVEAFDADPSGTYVGFTALTNNRYWQVSPIAGTGTLTAPGSVRLTETGLTASTKIGKSVSTTPGGTYANLGGAVSLGTPGTITNVTAQGNYGTGANSTYFITGTPGPFPAGIYSIGPDASYTQPDTTPYDGTFTSLTNAINAANNASVPTSGIIFEIQANYVSTVETFPIASTYQGTSAAPMVIRPRLDAAAAALITGASATPLFDFNSAKYITIDGRKGGTGAGKFLTINNTSATGNAIRFINDAQNNTVRYATLQGANTSATGGIILFSTTTGTTATVSGNTNNLIDNNDIDGGAGAAASPATAAATAIYSSGTGTYTNRNNTISNNNIFNYFSPALASNGISISSNSTDFIISGNKFYQTNTRTQTTSALHTGITISNTSGNNFQVTGNIIGFAQNTGTGVYTLNGVGNSFRAINVSVGTTTITNVTGNTVAGISQTTTATGSASTSPFMGIYISSGLTEVSNNTIGSQTGISSISYTNSTTTGTDVNAIYNFGSSNWIVTGNLIGGITAANSNVVPAAANIYGIRVNTSSSATFICQNNTIGGTVANSIFGSNASAANIVTGISNIAPIGTISGNIVRNLSSAGGAGTGAGSSVIGIALGATSAAQTVTSNTISLLANTNTTAVATVTGINIGASGGANLIAKNFIHSLSIASTSAAASLFGINVTGGTATYQNNFISLGNGVSNNMVIAGINETAGTDTFRFNSVYIGGTASSTTANTYAFRSAVTTNTRAIQDNIFLNARSSSTGTGKHYAINFAGTAANPAGLTSNYNLLRATGTGGFTGLFNGTDYATLDAFKVATGTDANSVEGDPAFANAPANDLHLTVNGGFGSGAEGLGIAIPAVTDDFDSQVRANLTPTDIGADAGDYAATGVDVGITALINPTATSCHSATENVVVTIRNFSGTTIDFATNNVTVTVAVSGAVSSTLTYVLDGTNGPATLAGNSSINITAGQINTTANGTYTFTSSTAITSGTEPDLVPANNQNISTVTINYTALSLTATAGTPTICNSGSSTLIATATGGTTPYATYLWSGGTTPASANNNTGTITATQTYNVTVTDACGVSAPATVTVTVNTPTITSTTPGTRCGPGSVTLAATAGGGGTPTWYAASTGGSSLFTGSPFNTPSIAATTTYYVASEISGGATNATLGLPTDPTASANTATTYPAPYSNYYGGAKHQMLIRASELLALGYSSGNINSVSFTVNSVGTTFTGSLANFQINMKNTTSTVLSGSSFEAGLTAPATLVYGPLTQSIPVTGLPAQVTHTLATPFLWDGTSNIVIQTSYSNANSGTTTDFVLMPNTNPGFVSSNWYRADAVSAATILAATTPTSSGNARPNMVLNINQSCASPRTAVIATITATAPITVSSGATICAGQSANLTVSSPNDPNYTYTWTPAGSLSPATGSAVTATPAVTTTYTVNAVDNTTGTFGGCANSATVVVTVNPAVTNVTAIPSATSVCVGGTISLSSPRPPALLNESFDPITPGWTYATPGPEPWLQYTGIAHSGTNALGVVYDADLAPMNAWAFTPGVSLTAGVPYKLSFWYTNDGGTLYTEKMEVTVGTAASIAAQTAGTNLYSNTNIAGGYAQQTVNYTPATSGTYYFGFHGFSNADQDILAIDDIVLAPLATETFAWTSTPAGFTSSVQNPTGVMPTAPSTTYTVVVSNQFGCSASATSVPVTLSTLAVNLTNISNVSCFGGSNGSIAVTATGGAGTYGYTIAGPTVNTTGATSGTFTGLTPGSYTITVTDATCSVASAPFTVTQPATALTISVTGSTNPVCYNSADGSISASASGGTTAYTYTIAGPTVNTTGATSGVFTGLTAGTGYIITVTDANGCIASTGATTLTAPTAPLITASNNGPVCAGSDATLTASAGFVSYLWTGPGTINDATSQVATAVTPANNDVFTVAGTDANGCTVSATTTVTVNPLLPVSVSISVSPGTEICSGTEVTFTATPANGGTTPTYQWYVSDNPVGPNAATFVTTDLVDGDYVYVIITSNEPCVSGNPATSNTINIFVQSSVETSVLLAASANPSCTGSPVTYTATPTGGGTAPLYEFFLNGNSAQSGSSATYTYTPAQGDEIYAVLTSSFECASGSPATSATITMTVNPVPAAPVITPDGPTTFCEGGSVILSSNYTGGNVWSTSETTDQITVTTAGSYTVTQTQLGCTSVASAPVVITVNPNPVVNITGTLSFCTGGSTLLTANVTAGGPATTYSWTLVGTGTVGSGPTYAANQVGSYTVTVSNGNCSTTSEPVAVTENTPPAVGVTASCSTLAPGQTATLTATPATGVTYSWSLNGGPSISTTNPYVTAPGVGGTYTVTVTSIANGCTASASVVINALSGPLAAGSYAIPSNCGGFTTIAAAASYLNANGVGGNVVFNVASGYTETAIAGGIVIGSTTLNATLNGTKTVTFQKDGATANPVITAFAPQASGSLLDGVVKLVGADFISFNGIDVKENAANTTTATATNNMTEFGYALLYLNTTDGAHDNSISNSSISLNKAYANTFGVYSNVRHSSTNATTLADITDPVNGPNKNNRVYSNTISNVNTGLVFIGSATAANQDDNNDIGGAGLATGNTINNFGGLPIASAYVGVPTTAILGVYMLNQKNFNVSFNTFASAALNTATGVRGILTDYSSAPTGTIVNNINSNTVSFTQAGGAAVQAITTASTIGALANVTQNSNANSIINNVITGAASTLFGVANLGAYGTLNMNNNIIRSNTSSATTGGLVGVTNQGAVVTAINMNNNQIGNATGNAITYSVATSGGITGISNTAGVAGSSLSITGNDFRGFVQTVAGSNAHSYIVNTATTPTLLNFNTNTFTDITANTSGSVTFIGNAVTLAATAVCNMNNNSIVKNTVGFTKTVTGGAVTVTTTNSSTPAGAVFNYLNNNFSNITVTGTTTFTGISNTDGGAPTKVLTGNTFNNLAGGTGTFLLMNISFNGGASSLTNNIVSNIATQGAISAITVGSSGTPTSLAIGNNNIFNLNSTGAGGAVLGISIATPATVSTVTSNTVNNLTTTAGAATGITTSATTNTLSLNTVSNLSSAGASASVLGMAVTGGTKVTLDGNTIRTLSGSGATTPVVSGISVSGGTSVIVRKNKIYDLSQSAALTSATTAGVNGISVTGGTDSIYNNIIGDLRAPASNQPDAIRGIAVTSTSGSTTINVAFNTVYLNATSTGANFGTSGLFHTGNTTATTARLELRSNIFVNTSTPGSGGLTAAYRRSNANSANFAQVSNSNLYYAGTPGATRLIFTDGAASYQTIGDYRSSFNPIDADAVTENPNWLSTTGVDPTYLHINPAIATVIESGGVAVTGIADDYDGDIRFGNPGYTGTGTSKPDIGADEFNGQAPGCVGANGGVVANNSVNLCTTNTTATLASAGASSGAGITYQWQVAAALAGPYSNVTTGTGATTPTYTTPNNLAAGVYYYKLTVTCVADPQNPIVGESNVATVTVSQTPVVTAASNSPVCVGQTLTLTGTLTTGPAATTYSWTGPNGFTSTSLNPAPITNVTAAAAGVYSLTATNNGCASAVATTTVVINVLPTVTATATPTTVCAGSPITLTSSASIPTNYDVTSKAFNFIVPTGTPTTLSTLTDDNLIQIPTLPFPINFFGSSYTTAYVHSNGFVTFNSGQPTGSPYTDVIPATPTPNNFVALLRDDLNVTGGGTVKTFTNGVTPNQVFVIEYNAVKFYNVAANNGNLTGQIQFFEADSHIEIHIQNSVDPTTPNAKSVGIENATGTVGVAAPGRNNVIFDVTTPEAWSFTAQPVAATYVWSGPSGFTSTSQNTTVPNPTVTGAYTVTATLTATGCSASATTASVTVNPRPTAVISGSGSYCAGATTTTTLSIAVNGTGSFTGTLSDGTAFSGSAPTITVQVTPTATTTYTIATLNGTPCSSIPADLSGSATVTVNPLPATPTVSVTQPTCTTATGSITVTAPTGAGFQYSIGSGYQASPVFNNLPAGTYSVSVQSNFGCISAVPASATVNPQPFTPGAPTITGITNVCPYIGTGEQLTYIASAPGATAFNWILPPNVTVVSGGAPTNQIVLTFNNGYAAQINKQIRVTATSACGTSPIGVFYTLAQSPVTPAPISGPTNVCALIGTTTTATYSIPATQAATFYTWSIPAGVDTTHPNGPGANDLSIVVTFNAGFTGGAISVTANNGCGASGIRTTNIVNTPPALPSLISGPTNVCPYKAPNGVPATYSVAPIAAAASYNWTVPAGATITYPNGQGTNGYTVNILFPSTFTSGSISVSATNGCGTSGMRSLTLTTLNPSTPGNIDVQQTAFCNTPGGRIFTYTLAGAPANSTSVLWTIPVGASFVSGQGSTSITVMYPQTAVQGNVTAQGVNNCGTSQARSVPVRLPSCPEAFAGNSSNNDNPELIKGLVKVAPVETMEVKIFPNPTVSDFKLEVLTSGKDVINVRVFNDQGKLYKTFRIAAYQVISLGAELQAGAYLVEVRQGQTVKTTKVIKF